MTDKFVVVDSNGVIVQRLLANIHAIPSDAIGVTDDLWQQIIQLTAGVWTRQEDGGFAFTPAADAPVDIPALIANTRYRYETSGIDANGVTIDTGRDSQALITGATLSAMLDSEYVCTWKTVTGPVQLNSAQLIAIASAVRAHVQACFDRECELLAAVADGSFTDAMLTEGWPV